MKKTYFLVLSLVFALILGSTSAMADDMTGTWTAGVKAGYNNVLDDTKIETTGGDLEYKYDDTFILGVNAAYYFNKYCSLAFGIDYSEYTFTQDAAGTSTEVADIQQIPVYFTVRGHWANESIATPYAGIGMGYYFNNLDLAPSVTGLDIENDLGFHVVGGVDVRFADSFGMDVELKYTDFSTDYKFSGSGITLYETTDLNAFSATLGFKYYFK